MIIITIIVFVVILGVLIFVHELGHFIAAKKMGVRVEEFGFGFPPRIFGIKRGETTYSLNWIPIGGFVKMTGQSDFEVSDHAEAKADPRSFVSKKPWRRVIILGAGVAMNFLLAMILLSIGFMIGLPSAVGDNLPAGARTTDQRIQILGAMPNSPAEAAEFRSGDTILSLDGSTPLSVTWVQDYVAEHTGQTVVVKIERGAEVFEKEVTPRSESPSGEGPLGINLAETARVSFPWYQAIGQGVKATGGLTVQIVAAFGKLIGALFTSGQISSDVAGPIGIAVLTGQVTKLGFVYVLQFTALLSINLAIINILPFPALDGGHLLFLLIEKIRGGKTIKQAKVENIIHLVGFALLLLLIALVTYRDLGKFWGKFFG